MSTAAMGAGLVSGVLGLFGQSQANKANAKEAAKNRDFQERMSNTSHQRQVADLEAAGLNPLLSATGGASQPGGAQAQMQNVGASAIDAANTGMQLRLAMKKQKQEIANLKATEKKTKSETTGVDQMNIIKGPLTRGSDTLNWLFDSLGNKGSKYKTNTKTPTMLRK